MTTSDISRYRDDFPITHNTNFLSHAAVSPLNRRAAQAVQHHMEQAQQVSFMQLIDDLRTLFKETRQQIATLINARSPEEIVLMPNTATGLNTVAASLPLQSGDNVLILDGDYPANIYPWMNLAYRGVLTKIVPQVNGGLDVDVLAQRIDNRTRAIALSTVMFASGFRNDIEAVGKLCKERGIFFVVDGIQSLGAFPMDVQTCNIDFLAAGSQKWLLSAPGSGFLYCRQEMQEQIVPGAYVGASSVVDAMNYLDYNLTYPQDATRFDIGTPNIMGIVALNATLALLQEVTIARISEQIHALVNVLIEDLLARGYHLASSTEPQHRSGIVVAKVPDAEATCKALNERGVIVTPRGGGVRIAPHFYNTRDEVLAVGHLLDSFASST
jgi:selenocysteine lyase/cysteine desulfurase